MNYTPFKSMAAAAVLLSAHFSAAAACDDTGKCISGWVAAHNTGNSQTFLRSETNQPLKLSDLKAGLVIKAGTDIYVRTSMRTWDILDVFKENQTATIEKVDKIGTPSGPQTWVQIRPVPTFVPTAVPTPDENGVYTMNGHSPESYVPASPPAEPAPPAVALPGKTDVARGIWWEYTVAEATGGYDADNNRTLINHFDLVVHGPSSVESAARKIAEDCVHVAGGLAYKAFQATPSPEIGARIGAAWAAFQTSIVACLQADAVTAALKDQFDLGYVRRGDWEPGLNLRFAVNNPATDNYRQLHNLVKDQLPDPLNQVITFYIATTEIPKIDFRMDPPRFAQPFLKTLPPPELISKYIDQIDMQDGEIVLPDFKKEVEDFKARGEQMGKTALEAPGKLFNGTVRLKEEAAKALQDTVKSAGREFVSLAPHMEDGRVVVGPIKLDIPKPDDLDYCKHNWCPDLGSVIHLSTEAPKWSDVPVPSIPTPKL